MIARVLLQAAAAFLAVQLLIWIGLGLHAQKLDGLHDQHLLNTVDDLAQRLQTRLNLGMELADSVQQQALLEDAAARTPELLALEILSSSGTSLFSSDRGLRGQRAPDQWLEALETAPQRWHATRQDERSIAAALQDATGKLAGYLVLSYHPSREDDDGVPQVGWISWAACVATAVLGAIREHRARSRLLQDLEVFRGAQAVRAECDAACAARCIEQARTALAASHARASALSEQDL